MRIKTIGLIVVATLILTSFSIWGINRLKIEHQRHITKKHLIALGQAQTVYSNDTSGVFFVHLIALGQAQTVYSNDTSGVFFVQNGQVPNEMFDGEELHMESKIYTFTMNDIDGNPVSLAQYQGNVVLIVNVASKCGFTKQYAGLQALYEKYQGQGFVILGFPANNFMGQEPGTDAEIKAFCTTNFNVTFPMFSKISVKGKDIHPLYQYLTNPEESGEFGTAITWNFNKFLIDKNGTKIGHFGSRVDPLAPEMINAVEKALKDNL